MKARKCPRVLSLILSAVFLFSGCTAAPAVPPAASSSRPAASSSESAASAGSSAESSSGNSSGSSSESSHEAVSSSAVSSANAAFRPASSQAAASTAPQPKKTLQGTITALTSDAVTVTASGASYRFARSDRLVDPAGASLRTGRQITVTYRGTLKASSGLQQVEVLRFLVTPDPAPSVPNTAESLLKTLSLEEKVAQMFIVRCPQTGAADTIAQNQFGGYVLFGRDFKNKTKAQAVADIKSYQKAAKVPLLIAVDEEGGTVNRVSLYKAFRDTPFLSPQELFAKGGLPLIKEDTREKSTLLRSLGINLNLAPVCDVSTNPDDYIYRRTFGQGAAQTAEYIKTVVSAMRENKMGAALKHFPGYGSNADTHTGIAVDDRPLSQFRQSDFLPFQSGINAGAGVVLVSHNIVTAIEPGRPASLSAAAHRLLREELGFEGLIMTDDLSMGAIRDYTGGEEAAVLAVLAGNDLLCCTDYKTQYAAVLKAVKSGRISEARIDESALRILRYKFSAGLIA